jgi:hypothetical protein
MLLMHHERLPKHGNVLEDTVDVHVYIDSTETE